MRRGSCGVFGSADRYRTGRCTDMASSSATRLAGRMSRLGTESAFEVLARARALEATGRKIIHLEIGEPDFATPAHIVEAAEQGLRDGYTHYVPAPGLPEAREAVAAWLSKLGRLMTTRSGVVSRRAPSRSCGT